MFDFQASDNNLNNKIILVTGAGDGIGKQAALSYAKQGATVILLGKTVEKLEAVFDQIIEIGGLEPAIIPLDMKGATPEHYRGMANTIESQFGKLDGVLLNASILGELTPFAQIHQQTWNDVMHINLTAQFQMLQALIPVLKLSESASIIFTTSSVGSKGRAFWGPYSISKFATEGMMQVLADEYEGSNIRANAINPGATETKMRASAFPAEDKEKLAKPEDIMPIYLYLMSQESTHVNGQTFNAQD